jgi:hypothetical protein
VGVNVAFPFFADKPRIGDGGRGGWYRIFRLVGGFGIRSWLEDVLDGKGEKGEVEEREGEEKEAEDEDEECRSINSTRANEY